MRLNPTGRGFVSARANSRYLQTRKTARRPRQCPLLDGPSRAAAQRIRHHSVWVSPLPHCGAICRLADPHDACSRTGTDRADRIAPTAVGELQQRDSARLGCLSPPDTRSSYSESLPHERARLVKLRSSDQTASPSHASVRRWRRVYSDWPHRTAGDDFRSKADVRINFECPRRMSASDRKRTYCRWDLDPSSIVAYSMLSVIPADSFLSAFQTLRRRHRRPSGYRSSTGRNVRH